MAVRANGPGRNIGDNSRIFDSWVATEKSRIVSESAVFSEMPDIRWNPCSSGLPESLSLRVEELADALDRFVWNRMLLKLPFEGVDERLVGQLLANAGKLLG